MVTLTVHKLPKPIGPDGVTRWWWRLDGDHEHLPRESGSPDEATAHEDAMAAARSLEVTVDLVKEGS